MTVWGIVRKSGFVAKMDYVWFERNMTGGDVFCLTGGQVVLGSNPSAPTTTASSRGRPHLSYREASVLSFPYAVEGCPSGLWRRS